MQRHERDSGGTALEGLDLHCARKGKWKLRFAQLTGEIYINDYTAGHESFWLLHPELYNLDPDPGESYDVASLHPDVVQQIIGDVSAQMKSMPSGVQDAFTQLQKNVASPRTRVGAAPIPANVRRPAVPTDFSKTH